MKDHGVHFDCVVEQQRYALEETSRIVRDELRCEIGSLRQYLQCAEIRESLLNRSLEKQRDVQRKLEKRLLDAERRISGLRNEVALEPGWLEEQETPHDQLRNVLEIGTFAASEFLGQQYMIFRDWEEAQQRLYHKLRNQGTSRSSASVVEAESWGSDGFPSEPPPPPYEQEAFISTSRVTQPERNSQHRHPWEDQSRLAPHVRLADPLESALDVRLTMPGKGNKAKRKQVIGLERKKNNRTAV